MGNRFETVRVQLRAVEALRLLHQEFSYAELERLLGISRSVLAQYVTGARLPSYGQALLLIERMLSGVNLAQIIAKRLQAMSSIADLEDVVLDPLVLSLASLWIERSYRGRVDVVLSAETIGVPLATAVALSLGTRLVIARRRPESPVKEYIQAGAGGTPFERKVFYIPRDKLPRGARVLLVDDLARTGITLEALARGVMESGGTVVAAITIIALGPQWRERLRKAGVRDMHAFLELA